MNEKTYLSIKRVRYGSASTPKHLREYRIVGQSPVGTVEEWKEYAASKNHSGIYVAELDGTIELINL